jgi:hypothetical protein
MDLFEQWYHRNQQKNYGRLPSKEEIAKMLFLYHYRKFPPHLKESWSQHILQHLITKPIDVFTAVEHFDEFVVWCHERDIQI